MSDSKIIYVVISVIVVALVVGLVYFGYAGGYFQSITKGDTGGSVSGNTERVIVTKDTLPSYLETQGFVKDMPSDGIFEFDLYNFNSGEREWEESYLIKKGRVTKIGGENKEIPDAIIIIHSKYIDELQNGFCNAMKNAKQNGDVGLEFRISETSFLWKYRGILKYKDCLGI